MKSKREDIYSEILNITQEQINQRLKNDLTMLD